MKINKHFYQNCITYIIHKPDLIKWLLFMWDQHIFLQDLYNEAINCLWNKSQVPYHKKHVIVGMEISPFQHNENSNTATGISDFPTLVMATPMKDLATGYTCMSQYFVIDDLLG